MKDYCNQLARVCLAPEAPAEDLAALGGDPDAWQVYRWLVRARLGVAVTAAYPRLIALVGAAVMDAWVTRFLAEDPPRSRFVRAIPGEFLAFLRGHMTDLGATPRALDLADYECAVLDVTYESDPDDRDLTELSMDLPAVLAPAHRLLAADWPVDLTSDGPPKASPGTRYLCVYRAPTTHQVLTLVLTPTTHALLARIDAGVPLAEAFRQAAGAHGFAIEPGIVGGFVDLLSDLLERGLVRGSRVPPAGA